MPHPAYPPELLKKIEQYRTLYRRLFRLAADADLQVFITTDLLFFNPAIEALIGGQQTQTRTFAAGMINRLLDDFPEIAGVIIRIGESDAVDVNGDFHSRIVLKTPRQARSMLQTLLPVFEKHQRLLIFRTWTVGVSRLGDLIWNRDTFRRVFADIHSPALIISMKYGESDFFRYLPLNRLFFESDHRKLIEFQTRREYEGFGRYPASIARDYEHIIKQLVSARNIAGISIWCQTGGWSGFRDLTLLDPGGIWNEINTFITVRMFRDKQTADQAMGINTLFK